MVRKEASEVVHFSTGAKPQNKHGRLLSKIKWNKFAAVELLTPNDKKRSIRSCALQKLFQPVQSLKISMLDFCQKLNGTNSLHFNC